MTVFNWLDEITVKKSPSSQFSQEDWNDWNSYMVHRFLSMNMGYINIVNIAQKFHPTDKEGIYNFYKEILPQRKIWNKYIKNKNKKDSKELLKIIAKYLELGMDEVNSLIPILNKDGISDILNSMGFEKKEIKKLIKTI
jgi:hypothetical protein|tara:strand:+ start:4365 stop:4781 length:417 start_codon:yes stop_codon:yes gene_type:complete